MLIAHSMAHTNQSVDRQAQVRRLIEANSVAARRWIHMAEYYLFRLRRVPLKKALMFGIDFVRNWEAISSFLRAPVGSNLHRLIVAYPEIIFMASGPYLAENWDARQRFARIADHCNTATAIGGIIDLPPNTSVELCQLTIIDSRYRLVLHQPREFVWEGLLDLSLFDGDRPIFSLRFCLSSDSGKRLAYIGALQGRRQRDNEPSITETYNSFSKAMARMRPRDFMIDVFQMLCRELRVSEIQAVADHNKPRRCFKRSYDQDWAVRGGENAGNGFFRLPVSAKRRAEDEMPAKKRAMYHQRYAILAMIERELASSLRAKASTIRPSVATHRCAPTVTATAP